MKEGGNLLQESFLPNEYFYVNPVLCVVTYIHIHIYFSLSNKYVFNLVNLFLGGNSISAVCSIE